MNTFRTKSTKRTKCFAILSLVFLLCISYTPVFAQNVKEPSITIKVKDEPIKNVFKKISQSSNYKFFFDEDVVSNAPKITFDVNNADINTVLNQLRNQSKLDFIISGKTITVSAYKAHTNTSNNLTKEKKKITGIIKDEAGETAIGASVKVKGEPTGTVTDIDGKFTLDVPSNATLVISYIGFMNKEIQVGDKSTFDIVLQEDSKILDEVVVIGYGTMRKSDFTGSLANIKADELALTSATFGQALVGRIAGVQVSQPSGAPGQGTKIKVRGVGSLSASTSPLYVVDGYPASEDVYINPEDIESVDVLKDAASAAIYGSRGASGVVMITTKRGKTGKTRIDYDYQFSVQEVERKIKLLDAWQFRDLVIDARNNSYRDKAEAAGVAWSPFDDNAARAARGFSLAEVGIDPIFFDFTTGKPTEPLHNTDWQDAIYSNAPMHRHNISVSGGSDAIRYRTSFAYLDQDGIISPSSHQRMNLRANLDAQVTKRLKVGFNFALSDVKERQVKASGRFMNDGVVQSALMSYPQFPVYNEDGSYAVGNQIAMKATGYAQVENPVALAHEIDIREKETRTNFNTNISYEFFDWLSANANIGTQYTTRRYNYYRPRSVGQDGDMPNSAGAAARVKATDVTNYDIDRLGEFTFNYKNKFGLHKLDAVAGFTLQKKTYDRVSISATGMSDDRIRDITAFGPDPSNVTLNNDTRKAAWTMMSYLGRVNYFFDNRYSLSGTVRTDGSSRFGPKNKWGWFPSISAGWSASNESFYKDLLGETSSLKLRASWGLSGNNNIGNYEVYPVMHQGGYPFGNGIGTAYWQGTIKDQSIGWEKTSQFNTGFDLTLFNNRLSIIGNYYNSISYDLLYDMPVSAISGSTSIKTNLRDAKVRNRGIDLQLDTRILTGEFQWNLGGNISVNRNKVLSMGGLNDIYLVGERNVVSYVTKAGLPIGSFYGYWVDGIISETDYANILIDKNVWATNGNKFPDGYTPVGPAVPNYNNVHAGDTKWRDVDGNGRITEDDKDILGDAYPDFTYGISTDFAYKGFDLRATFTGSKGGQVLNFQKFYLFGLEGYGNQLSSALDRWHSDADPGKNNVHRASRSTTPNISNRLSSYMIDDASYFRCANITLGYSFPKNLTSKMFLQSCRVYVSVDNLFTITDYEGYNPEIDSKGSNLMPGFDWGDYPLARTFSVGAKITF